MISNIIKEIDNILKLDIDTVENTDMTTYDLTERDIIKKYGWGSTQQALFQILSENICFPLIITLSFNYYNRVQMPFYLSPQKQVLHIFR